MIGFVMCFDQGTPSDVPQTPVVRSPLGAALWAGNLDIRDPETSGEFITLARVVKTQGRRGEVANEILSDIPGRFSIGMCLFALLQEPDGRRRELEVEELWPHKGLLVLKFAGVDSISDAEALIGCELQVPRSQRSALQAGWNYVSDLIGCLLLDRGREIGKIEDVQFGAGEAPLLIVRDVGGRMLEVPFAEAYLDGIDVERKQVPMKLPEGLLEVNAPLTEEEKREQAQPARRKRH
jgi:16S rRNA processing protein RimM